MIAIALISLLCGFVGWRCISPWVEGGFDIWIFGYRLWNGVFVDYALSKACFAAEDEIQPSNSPGFSESLRSIRDIQLYSSQDYFVSRFTKDGAVAKRNDRLAQLLPSVPRFLIEPAGITVLFAVGLAPAVLVVTVASCEIHSLPWRPFLLFC